MESKLACSKVDDLHSFITVDSRLNWPGINMKHRDAAKLAVTNRVSQTILLNTRVHTRRILHAAMESGMVWRDWPSEQSDTWQDATLFDLMAL